VFAACGGESVGFSVSGISLVITGRSSSHFTRVVRVFAYECGTDYRFDIVRDLRSSASLDYAGNPALKIPVLTSDEGARFGALNICRELVHRATRPLRVIWPEHLDTRIAANAQELVLQGMASEVTLILRGDAADAHVSKTRLSLTQSIAWLEVHLPEALHSLPIDRSLSFLEVSSFCFLTHLPFREVLELEPYPNLRAFCSAYAERPAAQATGFRFDQV
jgi:glutathione S-transferase